LNSLRVERNLSSTTVKRAPLYSNGSPFRREISELIPESKSQKGSESKTELEVDAFT